MSDHPKLIVMLTYHDLTLENAAQIFEECRDSKAEFWGFKEEPLPLAQMKALCARMKECGKTTFLEVVSYSEEEGLNGAKKAADCGFDVLMGTMYYDSIHTFCKEHGLQYMPYVGHVTERPSILSGPVSEIIGEAKTITAKGVDGFDLLGYRYTGDAARLDERFTAEVPAPVCIAGSVDSYERLMEIKSAGPWAFTIGGAFYEHKFGTTWKEQIDLVCDFMNSEAGCNRT